ncbi:CDP-alcohol phosphatidyltransferase family protein [uncultured Fusobacterium sp.]|uniref:CDP-alcohol phosphatidyltransferase family protein n=1 Tax=uncultured Fusobacterium sp. TaxID=159267 RepID=UPI0025EBA59A|nr:CDP-alcohol phosphatidyltransferase family protein [uncultured Fusobacterium sp.]
MLDTHCRRYVQPIIGIGANFFLKLGFTANGVTILAMLIGVSSGIFTYLDYNYIGVLVLWLSGYLDAVDGTIARETNSSSAFGTIMDITFDRMVEASVIIGVASRYRELSYSAMLLSISIIITMTIFLTTGSLTDKKSEKSFYYQAGLAERTEGFIMFSLIILLKDKAEIMIYALTIMIIITILQRFLEARKIVK